MNSKIPKKDEHDCVVPGQRTIEQYRVTASEALEEFGGKASVFSIKFSKRVTGSEPMQCMKGSKFSRKRSHYGCQVSFSEELKVRKIPLHHKIF